MQKLSDDPYFETRQREERFIQQIVNEVGKAFIAEMPKFLAGLMLSLNQGYAVQAPAQPVSQANNTAEDSENDDYSDIDLDFIGG